jgi:hypothetical protein
VKEKPAPGAAPAPGLEAFADEKATAKYRENERIARQSRVLRARLTETERELLAARDGEAAAVKALSLYEREYAQRPKWLTTPKSKTDDRGTLLAVLSDTHYGEVVDPAEVGGFNKYDLSIADQRTERFFRRTIRVARNYFAGVKYDGIVLALGGDLVSGDIHDELQQTNEASTYETILWAVPRLAAGVEMLAQEFGQVHVVSVPGNHGRDGKIPRYKGRSAHNADTLIARLVAMQLGKSGDVTFEIPRSLDAPFRIYDFNFSIEHGEELARSFSGSAEIGALGPLMRGTNRKKVAMAAEGVEIHYCVWCHFHQFLPLPSRGFIANGSVKGWDEYARGRKFTPEQAQQALVIVDPVRGVTLPAPVFVADRKSEGW